MEINATPMTSYFYTELDNPLSASRICEYVETKRVAPRNRSYKNVCYRQSGNSSWTM
jgi:hypothetical protein